MWMKYLPALRRSRRFPVMIAEKPLRRSSQRSETFHLRFCSMRQSFSAARIFALRARVLFAISSSEGSTGLPPRGLSGASLLP